MPYSTARAMVAAACSVSQYFLLKKRWEEASKKTVDAWSTKKTETMNQGLSKRRSWMFVADDVTQSSNFDLVHYPRYRVVRALTFFCFYLETTMSGSDRGGPSSSGHEPAGSGKKPSTTVPYNPHHESKSANSKKDSHSKMEKSSNQTEKLSKYLLFDICFIS